MSNGQYLQIPEYNLRPGGPILVPGGPSGGIGPIITPKLPTKPKAGVILPILEYNLRPTINIKPTFKTQVKPQPQPEQQPVIAAPEQQQSSTSFDWTTLLLIGGAGLAGIYFLSGSGSTPQPKITIS